MSAPLSTLFSDAELAALARLADAIAPRAGRMPSASDLGLVGPLLERALAARPDLVAPLKDLLGEVGEEPDVALERWERQRPDAFAVAMQAIAGAYYMHPRVRALIGYDGPQRTPISADEEG